ncbi:apolipoprotein N-acyltransferase [Altericista sp. CCNU0014]|uniref:apolipoprotein N-acyltransferase n=1 Tax=Altericista sp. CCNU0014 TaxID=3082949 RepID=UPI00384B49A1
MWKIRSQPSRVAPASRPQGVVGQAKHRLFSPFQRFPPRHLWVQGGLLAGVGVLLGLSLAPAPTGWMAWGAIAPLWTSTVAVPTRKQAAFLGGCWGIGYHGAALFWLFGLHPLTWLGMPWVASLTVTTLAWGVATLWGACLPMVWAASLRWIGPALGNFSRIAIGTALWCGLEWLWSLSPLWWTDIANSQSPHNTSILHLSQLSGPIAITLALASVNGAVAEAWLSRQRKFLGVAIALCLAFHGLGWKLAQAPLASQPAERLSIGMIQGNIPTRFKLSSAGIDQSIETYRQGYETLAAQKVDAVLLPEGALPWLWGQSFGQERALVAAVRAAKVPLWAGTFVPKGEGYTQSLLSLGASGEVLSQYDKAKLVPLGEYLPFESVLAPILRRLSPLRMGMVAGSSHQVFETPFGRAIVGICYDSVFPELFRAQAAAGGQFILSIANNDPYSDRMMAQHHALDVMRAIESDRWLVRVTNTGLSATIDPRGRTLWKSAIDEHVTHVAAIERRRTQTLYVRFGNWMLPAIVFGSIGIAWKMRIDA